MLKMYTYRMGLQTKKGEVFEGEFSSNRFYSPRFKNDEDAVFIPRLLMRWLKRCALLDIYIQVGRKHTAEVILIGTHANFGGLSEGLCSFCWDRIALLNLPRKEREAASKKLCAYCEKYNNKY